MNTRVMKRAYYNNSIAEFLKEDELSIIGQLIVSHSNRVLVDLQKNAWLSQIRILKNQLTDLKGQVYFEFAIPRMGKKVDNIVLVADCVFVIEFKVGGGVYEQCAVDQVIDYTLDLKNFHQGSHTQKLIPMLIVTNAKDYENNVPKVVALDNVAKCNKANLNSTIKSFIEKESVAVEVSFWENSIYKPTPTIVEAAQALYKGHNVKEISRSDSGAINLSFTASCLNEIIEDSKTRNKKSICFVTGVPGAGKTLAGLNIANERMKTDEDEHAVFLSGNGPLVDVLREALARDLVNESKEIGESIKKEDARRKTNAFIQNIHHFRDEYIGNKIQPTEKVVVFDEAQRAWNEKQASSFMKRKKGIENFNMSEPEFLIDVMNRHEGWCSIICLIGGGQEINTGEAGIEAWVNSFKFEYKDWNIYYSNTICENNNYLKSIDDIVWLKMNGFSKKALHLEVSLRSFRSEKLSSFVHNMLEIELETSADVFKEIENNFPFYITRDIDKAKQWLRKKARGTERTGIIASSGARRLRIFGVDVKNEISAPNWFLNDKNDVRSSYFLEEVATEFDIQGLEIDWACVAWGANFYMKDGAWKFQNFKGTKWMNIKQDVAKEYLKNTYRVLLTRARQGVVIFVPKGSDIDYTRPHSYYDETWDYLVRIGLKEI